MVQQCATRDVIIAKNYNINHALHEQLIFNLPYHLFLSGAGPETIVELPSEVLLEEFHTFSSSGVA